jgi:alcohol dehydrogenase
LYKAIALLAPRTLQIQELPLPKPKPGQVLIRVAYSGICATDLAIYQGYYPTSLPLILGHELTGKVIDIGLDVSREYEGKLVCVEINETCQSRAETDPCPMCHRGYTNHCQRRLVMGIKGWPGAFAQFVLAPVRNIHLLPQEISLPEGVFIEPLAAAIQTFELSPINPGETVAVLGIGRLGSLICQVAALRGAKVIAIDQSDSKLSLARQLGAWEVISGPKEKVAIQLEELTEGCGPDMVVEATGNTEGLSWAIDLVRPGGVVALKSTSGQLAQIKATSLAVDEIKIQGSRCGPFPKAISLLKAGKVKVKPLITAIYPLMELERAFQAASGAFKILLEH